MTEETLFELVINTSESERAALLDRECAGDPALRARVEALVRADGRTEAFHPATTRTVEPQGTRTYVAPATVGEAGQVVAGRYTLVEVIGEGGMGSVWRAKQTEPVKRMVAVKLIKAGMDSKAVLARFEAERQALALMDHPNIAKILDGGVHENRPFFVMELVKGTPITEFCDARKLTPQQRLELFVPVCNAIQHAHQKGIIHRDIKPNNVLIALYDDRPVPKVIDFGVAKATGAALTEHTIDTGFGGVVGTPQYMSPEQATFNNLDIDTRTDVYALGVLLYELLAGSTPFARADLEKRGLLEILRVIREEEPTRPSTKLSTAKAKPSISANRGIEPAQLDRLLRGELDWIVMKALEKERTRRYDTANAFAADVERYLSGEPVQAVPPSTVYRVKKFVRRHQGQVIAASLVLFALVAGVIGTTLGLLEARRQTEIARKETDEKEKQRDVAEAEKKKAIEFRNKALDALRATTGTDVEKLLGEKTELTANETAYLEAIARRWQTFAQQEGMDEQSRAIGAEGHHRVAYLWHKLGRREEARPKYEHAVAIREKLVVEYPAVAEYSQELAMCHNNLGTLMRESGQWKEAEAQHLKGVTIQQKLAADFPSVPDYRQDLARSFNNLAVLLHGLGTREGAESYYRQALAVQDKLVADCPTVPSYRRELALTQTNLGSLLTDLGMRVEAEEQIRQGLANQEKLIADFQVGPEYYNELGASHLNLGNLLGESGKHAEAAEQYRLALVVQDKLVGEFPAVPAFVRNLGILHMNLGTALRQLGDRVDAEKQYLEGLAYQEKLASDFPEVPSYRRELAISHNNLGTLLRDGATKIEADEHHRKACDLQEKLVADYPDVSEYRVDLGVTYFNIGHLLHQTDKTADSLEWFQKAIDALQSEYKKDPRDVTLRRRLLDTYSYRALALVGLKKYTEAVSDWDQVIVLSPKEEQPAQRASRATSRLKAGMANEAVADVEELTKSPNWTADQWYNFACVYAVASGKIADKRSEYADRVMELLQKAIKAGYKDAVHMKTDTDLDALREREDFKKLLVDLEKMAPKPMEKK